MCCAWEKQSFSRNIEKMSANRRKIERNVNQKFNFNLSLETPINFSEKLFEKECNPFIFENIPKFQPSEFLLFLKKLRFTVRIY